MRTLNLDKLQAGLPEVSPTFGALFAEAAAVCLTQMGHRSGVLLKVEGEFEADFLMEWTQEIGELEKKSWKDMREAAEYGATAIALLILTELTDFRTFEREEQGQGSDFIMWRWSSESANLPTEWASLEISGILAAHPGNSIAVRISKKTRQVVKTKYLSQDVFIAVVEFGKPKAKIVKK